MGLLQMSFTGAILILVIVVIRAIAIHRLPKKTFLVLWIIALARLLLPFSVPSPFSVYSLVRGNEPDFQTSDTVVYENRQPMYQVEVEQIQNNPVVSNTTQTLQTAPHISIWTTLWIIGMLIFAGLFLVSYLRCRREFRTALPIHNAIITEWLDEHQLKRKIEIRQFSGISTPMTYGVIHPVILLPKNSDWENKQQLQYILFHEYVHICRYDTALKILATIALCIHWFNPMVWVMYILFNRDIELTCDECVVHNFGRENRSVYAKLLISMEERKNLFAPFCNNFSKNVIEERIESIMKTKKTSVITLVLACMIVVGTTGMFATSVSAGKDNHLTTEESTQSVTNNQLFPAQNVEWWTYEEYAEWLENEKVELQNMIGERGWTGGRGEFVWTQEIVDETIAMYEGILEDIKNGMLYSKTIDGEGDLFGMMSYDPENIESEINENLVTTADFAPYEPYGLVWDESEKVLFLNGQRVRYFLDGVDIDGMGTMSIRLEYADADFVGEIDVHTIRQRVQNTDGSFDLMGPLTGLEKYSQAEYDFNTLQVSAALDAVAYGTQEVDRHTEEMKELLQDYTPFGLSYEIDPTTGELSMSWQGKPVHSVFDAKKCVWIANNQNGFNLGSDAVDLEAVYEQGTLTNMREVQDSHITHNAFVN